MKKLCQPLRLPGDTLSPSGCLFLLEGGEAPEVPGRCEEEAGEGGDCRAQWRGFTGHITWSSRHPGKVSVSPNFSR